MKTNSLAHFQCSGIRFTVDRGCIPRWAKLHRKFAKRERNTICRAWNINRIFWSKIVMLLLFLFLKMHWIWGRAYPFNHCHYIISFCVYWITSKSCYSPFSIKLWCNCSVFYSSYLLCLCITGLIRSKLNNSPLMIAPPQLLSVFYHGRVFTTVLL